MEINLIPPVQITTKEQLQRDLYRGAYLFINLIVYGGTRYVLDHAHILVR
jgi:hypothetical protein